MSLTIPLLSLTPVGTTLLGWAFRHQVPTGFQAVGIALVLAGAVALGLRSGTWPGLRAYRREPGVRDMLLAALAWSLTAVIDQMALERGYHVRIVTHEPDALVWLRHGGEEA